MLFQLGTEESTRYGQISISALGLDRDLGFSRGHQGHQGHQPPDDEEEEDDDEVEDNNEVEDDDNNKDDNNHKGISALGLGRDLGFSRVHQGRQGHQHS